MEAVAAVPAEEARTEAARGRGGKQHSTRAAPSPDANNSLSILDFAKQCVLVLLSITCYRIYLVKKIFLYKKNL